MKKQFYGLVSFWIISSFILVNEGFSQCTPANTDISLPQAGGSSRWSQSFQATCTGTLDALRVVASNNVSGITVTIYEGDGFAGSVLGSLTSQSITQATGVIPALYTDYSEFDFSGEGITLTSGQTYTFDLSTAELHYDQSNSPSYTGGILYFAGGAQSTLDLLFEIDIVGASNAVPTDISLSNNSINQTATGVNVTVGTLTTTDADAGDSHTYSLVSGTGDTNNGSFNISGNTIRTSSALTAGSYSVRINTNDGTDDFAEVFSITVVDNVAPLISSIARQSPTTSPTNSDALVWDVTFDGAVANVDATDFTVTGTTGTIASVTNPSGNVYRVTASGGDLAGLTATVTLGFAGGQDIADASGNALVNLTPTGTNNNTFVVDNTAPSGYLVTIDQSVINANNDDVMSFTFAGAEIGATYNYTFTSSGGAGSVTGSGTIATATDQITGLDLTGLADGTISLSVTLTDVNGNTGSATTDTETKETVAPTVSLSTTSSNPTSDNPIPVTITFSEEVSGFVVGDITVGNGTATNFNTTDNIVFTADINPTGSNVTVDIASGVSQDLAGNNNDTALQFSIQYDEIDASISQVISPVTQFDITTTIVEVEVSNMGTVPLTNIPLTLSVTFNGTLLGTSSGTVLANVLPGTSTNFTFPDNFDFSKDGNYKLTVTSKVTSDADASNDSIVFIIGNRSRVTAPLSEDFESIVTTGTGSVLLTVQEDRFYFDGLIGWEYDQVTSGGRFSVRNDYTRNSRQMVTLDNPGGNSFNEVTVNLDLSSFDINNPADDIRLYFSWYDHGDEGDVRDVVEFRTNESDPFIEIYDFATNSNNGSWTDVQGIDIDQILRDNALNFTSTCQLRFSQNDNFPVNTDGISIDNVFLGKVIPATAPAVTASLTVAENVAIGTSVGTISVDNGSGIFISANPNIGDHFVINPVTLEVTTRADVDFEDIIANNGGSNILNLNDTLTDEVFGGDVIIPIVITVTNENDAPTLSTATAQSVDEDNSLQFGVAMTDASDVDGDNLYLIVESGANYTVSDSSITPTVNFNGTLTVPVKVTDGTDTTSSVDMIVTVNSVNDVPSLTSATAQSVDEDNSLQLGVAMTNAADIEDDALYLIVESGANYTVSDSTITPAANFHGTLTVPVKVTDGTETTASVDMTVAVNPVNDAPTLASASAQSLDEDNSLQLGMAMTDADDVDGDNLYLIVESGANYTVSDSTITPAANFHGTLTVPVKVTDGTETTASVDMTVAVNPVNDAPTLASASAQSLDEDNSLQLGMAMTDADDVDGDNLYLIVESGANYTVSDSTITPAANFHGTLTVPVKVTDGTETTASVDMIVTVDPVNDIPAITASQNFDLPTSISNGTSVGTVAATDIDAGTTFSNWTIISGNRGNVFAINPTTGEVTIQDVSALDFATASVYTLSLTVSDGTNVSGEVDVTIQDKIAPTPDVASLSAITMNCEVTTADVPTPTATDNSSGKVTVTNDVTFPITTAGTTVITWTYEDESGNTSTQTQNITVEASSIANVTFEDATVTYNGSEHSLAVSGLPSGATVSYQNNGHTAPGTYEVIATVDPNSNCASVELKATLTVEKIVQTITFSALPDLTFGGQVIQLEATGGDSGLPVTYTLSTSPSSDVATLNGSELTIEGTGTVTVTASQAGNEFYTVAADVTHTFEVTSGELFLPTLFSPNGDLTNDQFVLRGGGNISTITLSIFDRDGNEVYRSESLDELSEIGWDGTTNGTKQPQGVYIWVLKGEFTTGTPITVGGKTKGTIRLAR
ncbi:tandem-95 repeat protein [Flammeovirgaceae bacterium SG7u.111]|nr:tandem-95 repeat protein [Flammeovirgaceae bacterium SG7u.132]WPO36794.1 tandem-95 repeat protein [Flammeovirgaceae bacterium SG7u.111]